MVSNNALITVVDIPESRWNQEIRLMVMIKDYKRT